MSTTLGQNQLISPIMNQIVTKAKPQKPMDVMERKHGMDMYLLGHRKKMNTRHYLIN